MEHGPLESLAAALAAQANADGRVTRAELSAMLPLARALVAGLARIHESRPPWGAWPPRGGSVAEDLRGAVAMLDRALSAQASYEKADEERAAAEVELGKRGCR